MSAHLPWKHAETTADIGEFFARTTMQECAGIAAYVAALIANHAAEAAPAALEPSVWLMREMTIEICRCFRAAERAEGRP